MDHCFVLTAFTTKRIKIACLEIDKHVLRDTVRPLVSRSTPHVRCDSTRTCREGSHTEANAVSTKQCERWDARGDLRRRRDRRQASTRLKMGIKKYESYSSTRVHSRSYHAPVQASLAVHTKHWEKKRLGCETCQSAHFPSHQARRL